MKIDAQELDRARSTICSARELLPTAEDVDELEKVARGARDRGYLLPDEEEAIRFQVERYLHVRAALHQTLQSMRPFVPRFRAPRDENAIKAFLCAWLSGCMLMRAARYIVESYAEDPLVWKALNQADPVRGHSAHQFDEIRASSSRPKTLVQFFQAMRYAENIQPELSALKKDPDWSILVDFLEAEQPFLETQKRAHAVSFAKTRFARWRDRPLRRYQRVMFGLFEASGRAIAEMRNPLHAKRVGKGAREELRKLIQPGDILITRHDDAMSNLFLPGFWPHSALVIGSESDRKHLQVNLRHDQESRAKDPVCILEAKKDGVRFRDLEETLAVDAVLVLRPGYSSTERQKEAVERAVHHEGKTYDFEFDFTRSDRLVCTEVIYRTLEGLDGFHFELLTKAGRITLPAEDLLRQALDCGRFELIAVTGLKGNHLYRDQRALDIVQRSLAE